MALNLKNLAQTLKIKLPLNKVALTETIVPVYPLKGVPKHLKIDLNNNHIEFEVPKGKRWIVKRGRIYAISPAGDPGGIVVGIVTPTNFAYADLIFANMVIPAGENWVLQFMPFKNIIEDGSATSPVIDTIGDAQFEYYLGEGFTLFEGEQLQVSVGGVAGKLAKGGFVVEEYPM